MEAAVEGVNSVFKPVMTTILTTFIAFAPLFFMPGTLGKFVYVIPLVISLALLVSLMESTLALPAHITGGLKKHKHGGEQARNKVFESLRHYYRLAINAMLKFKYAMVFLFLFVLGSCVFYAVNYMDFVLFPSSTADRFVVLIETPTGSSLQATSDKTRQVEEIISDLGTDELDSYMARIGTFGDIGSSERENNAAILVALTPFASRDRTADDIIAEMREKVNKLEGFSRIRFMVDAGGPPVGRPIMLRVVGGSDATRKVLADDIYTFLETIEGTKDIDRDDKEGKQQVELKLKYDQLARIGVSVADVAQNVRIAYDGEVVTNVRYGDEDVDFRVIFEESVRKEPEYLMRLAIRNKGGHLTPLRQLASVTTGPGPSNFYHFGGDRAIRVSGDIDKNVTTPIKVSNTVLARFDVNRDYPGTRLIVGGEAEESEKSLNELFIILGIAALGIYFLLVLLFNSVLLPIFVMMAVPFGIVGVIIGFAIHDAALGFLAMTGIIGLAGVVVNDSLVLVNHVNELRRSNPEWTTKAVVVQGATDRLRAILLTTVSTVAGLMPLAYGIGGSDPYMSPMALALGWGLLFATPLTLVLIPCLYLISDDIGNGMKRFFSGRRAVAE